MHLSPRLGRLELPIKQVFIVSAGVLIKIVENAKYSKLKIQE